MKKITAIIALAACALSLPAVAEVQTPVPGVGVDNVKIARNSAYMAVDMDVDLQSLKVGSNRAVLLTPYLVNDNDSLALYSVGIYGRKRYFYYLRNGKSLLSDGTEESYRARQKPNELTYHTLVPYEEWMNGSTLKFKREDYGCCSALVDEYLGELGAYHDVVFTPQFEYKRPVADALKTRTLSGRAFIDFPVNRTELYPNYRNNQIELAKIIATIDSVRRDEDVTITSIKIKGFASPEGPYDNNIRLAKGRTETLKQYVQNLYKFEPGFIATDYEPEDWEGLREFVVGCGLDRKDEILALIDSDMAPDPKNDKLRSAYPEEYKFLFQAIYPALRHSDYYITYNIRSYTTPEEIRKVMYEAPHKLSLNELFVLAQSLEPGSDEYNEVFETAVRMFPNDETANLNAANSAMQRRDFVSAARYLEKAGDGAEAVYARGVLAALQADYDNAETLIQQAETLGMNDAASVLEHIQEVRKYAPVTTTNE
ncbi:MAG: DUF3868 domain-containing protein [Muribaculaceae bacterium]|nr:DUF3868 domain-containing protein [Muribaculaceae bacterium]